MGLNTKIETVNRSFFSQYFNVSRYKFNVTAVCGKSISIFAYIIGLPDKFRF